MAAPWVLLGVRLLELDSLILVSMTAKFFDRFEFERALWQNNLTRVADVDEAGQVRLKSGFAFLPPENYGQRHECR